MNDVPKDMRVYYQSFLVAGPKGDQAVVAFTLKQAQVAKLGVRDLLLVDGLDFPPK